MLPQSWRRGGKQWRPRAKSSDDVFGATLTRRQFVKTGGALPWASAWLARSSEGRYRRRRRCSKNSLDPTLPSSWIEIHPDNTVLIRTGKSDFGQGTTFTAYRQIVAEELSVPFEAITTVVAGDTDRTPDGSGAFDFLGRWNAEHPQGGRLYLPSAARSRVRTAGRAEEQAFREGRHRLRQAARAFRTATSSRASS